MLRRAAALCLLAAPAAAQVDYPFLDDFETGQLEPHWAVELFQTAFVRVDPWASGQIAVMGSTAAVDSSATMTVTVDLAGRSGVGLSFRLWDTNDEDHPEDGVWVSGVFYDEGISLGKQHIPDSAPSAAATSFEHLVPNF